MSCLPISLILFSVWLPQSSMCFSHFLELRKFTKNEFFILLNTKSCFRYYWYTFGGGGFGVRGISQYRRYIWALSRKEIKLKTRLWIILRFTHFSPGFFVKWRIKTTELLFATLLLLLLLFIIIIKCSRWQVFMRVFTAFELDGDRQVTKQT